MTDKPIPVGSDINFYRALIEKRAEQTLGLLDQISSLTRALAIARAETALARQKQEDSELNLRAFKNRWSGYISQARHWEETDLDAIREGRIFREKLEVSNKGGS